MFERIFERMATGAAAYESNHRARQAREWAALMTSGKPDSLTEEELQREDHDVTRPSKNRPRAVSAWVRYAGQPVHVKGWAVEWTARWVRVRWLTPALAWHEAAVWVGGVDERQPERNEKQLPSFGLSVNSPR